MATSRRRPVRKPRPKDGAADVVELSKFLPASRFQANSLERVRPEPIDWLWEGWLARGKLSLFEGDGGVGKSSITIDFAARLSRGDVFPGEQKALRRPGNSLFVGIEDGIADTVVPRLMASDADMGRIFTLGSSDNELFTIPRDVEDLRGLIEGNGIEFCVIDPVTAFISEKYDQKQDAGVRRALTTLATMAEETKCAITLIRHFNKQPGARAQNRGSGSPAFVNLSRTVMIAVEDPQSPGGYVLSPSKNNIAAKQAGLCYEICETEIPNPKGHKEITVSYVAWVGTSDLTADQLVGADARKSAPARTAAEDLLRELLANGPVPAEEAKEAAQAAGVTASTLRKARESLGIKPIPGDRDARGKVLFWVWELPEPWQPRDPSQK